MIYYPVCVAYLECWLRNTAQLSVALTIIYKWVWVRLSLPYFMTIYMYKAVTLTRYQWIWMTLLLLHLLMLKSTDYAYFYKAFISGYGGCFHCTVFGSFCFQIILVLSDVHRIFAYYFGIMDQIWNGYLVTRCMVQQLETEVVFKFILNIWICPVFFLSSYVPV